MSPETRKPARPQLNIEGDAPGVDAIGWEFAAEHSVLPLATCGAVTPVAGADFKKFEAIRPKLEFKLGAVAFCQSETGVIRKAFNTLRGPDLAKRAETRTPAGESCRTWSSKRLSVGVALALIGLGGLSVFFPGAVFLGLTLLVTVMLVLTTSLRGIGAIAELRHARAARALWVSTRPHKIEVGALPRISILVPLYDERDIAARLVERLGALDYPRERLEVCLVLEDHDYTTADALAEFDLPGWMQIVTVPHGKLRTKPRAMNYALDFTHGDIVGIYDAEDMPAADQLMKVAAGFARAPSNVACLQGVLDFYNAKQSWLTRCFTIDYATWFRMILPGLVHLGIVIPLGGTTVFFRREALETLGRWDAHNVTEDADLGIRLARRGYRTEFVQSVTQEEATASVGAWVRQRSRWIKGYAVTWAVHMRDPARLWGELGPWRFMGVQILFLGTLTQFLLAPLLWSFWLVLFGISHPITTYAPWGVVIALATLFFLAEIVTLTIAAMSVAGPKKRWLVKWVPMMHLYFPLAAIASWKGIAELFWRPFFWDKTAHGAPVRRD